MDLFARCQTWKSLKITLPLTDAGCSSQGPNEDPAAAEVLSHLLADFDRRGAHDFALSWLNTLFASRPRPATDSAAADAAKGSPKAPADKPSSDAADGGSSPATGAGGAAAQPAGDVVDDSAGQADAAAAGTTGSAAYESVLVALLTGLRCCCAVTGASRMPLCVRVLAESMCLLSAAC